MTRKSSLPYLAALALVAPALVAPALALAQAPAAAPAAPMPPASAVTPDPWPKVIPQGGVTYTIFQPQLDSWDGYSIQAHAAVSVLPDGVKDATFGVLELQAKTLVDRTGRSVAFQNVQVPKASFPSAPGSAAAWGATFQQLLAGGPSTMSLDRLEEAAKVAGALKKGAAVPVKNEPPAFVFSEIPAVLVIVDDEPELGPAPGTKLQRVINTRALLLTDGKTWWTHVWDGWMSAPTVNGPWTVAKKAPKGGDDAAKALSGQKVVDLMTGTPDDTTKKLPTLKQNPPALYVAMRPTEMVVFQGVPDWVPIETTNLLYVSNTTGNVFMNVQDQRVYILVSGRWFSAPSLSGPWTYVPPKTLPPDFAKVPDGSPKENMKASVPGTPQAEAAIVAANVPQQATVDRTKAAFTSTIAGAPQLKPIPGTPLSYVFNSPDPIIMVSPTEWYSLYLGIWFASASPNGPWLSASVVPAVIYSIPPSSPLYWVTYVRIYEATPQYVVVGYTPGYLGEVVTPDGVVVYGTGYVYPAYVGAVWYPPPATYGYGVAMAWTPWTGWAMGFGFGLAVGFGMAMWGPAPCWGAAWGWHGGVAWGPGGWAATSGNVYHQWGNTGVVSRTSGGYNAWTGNAWSNQVAHSYNSTTGRMSAGQRGTVENVYTGNYAHDAAGTTYNPKTGTTVSGGKVTVGNAYTGKSETVSGAKVTGPGGQSTEIAHAGNETYADHDGNVYRYNSQTGSFQQHDQGGGWSNASAEKSQALSQEQSARNAGDQRSAGASWSHDDSGSGWDRGSSSGSSGSDRYGGGGSERSSGGSERSSGGWDRGSESRSSGGWGGGGFRGGGGGGFRGGGFRR